MANEPASDFETIRAIGAVCGAVLALVYDPPRTLRQTINRFVFSVLSGFIFAFIAIERFGWGGGPRYQLAAATFVAAVSWLLAGVVTKILKATDKWPSK